MFEINIYVDTAHLNYWWGEYGISPKTDWEDIIIYKKRGIRYKKIGWFCLCTKAYFRKGLEDLGGEYLEKIKSFLTGQKINYHYYYDDLNDEDFYEVPYEAERNNKGIKPRSIELWHPSEGIDKEVIDEAVREFCLKFFNIKADEILYKSKIPFESAFKQYNEDFISTGSEEQTVIFTDELIKQAQAVMKVSEEEAIRILKNSLK